MKCKAHILRDVSEPLTAKRWEQLTFRKIRETPDLAHGLGAFTTVLYHPDGHIYCGTTAFDNDILYRFDRAKSEFQCLDYPKHAEPMELKVHRSLELDTDGTIYGGTAGLYDLDDRDDAPGGSLFSFDPKTDAIEKFAVPVKHDYIQNITLDPQRRKICGNTYPVATFFCYDLEARQTVRQRYIGSLPHQFALDDHGRIWGTWSESNFLFAYDQDTDTFHFSRVALPGLERTDKGALDGFVNGGDGFLYLGTVQGALVRVDPTDPDAPKVEFLGKPLPKWRMPALVCGDDGLIYILAGGEYDVHILTYDRQARRFDDVGQVIDHDKGLACFMPHDLTLTPDGVAYAGETDHPERSGYFWECML
jgi:sugar lactone lactonase YvrE